MTTSKISLEEFAEVLIQSGDLDPDYIFMCNVAKQIGYNKKDMAEWIVLKSVVYDSISELEIMFRHKTLDNCHYGSERRKHKNNAKKFLKAFLDFAQHNGGSPYGLFNQTLPREAQLALIVLKRIAGVGDWAAWKVLDLCETVLQIPFNFEKVDFRHAYQYPLKGMLMVAGHDEALVSTLNKREKFYAAALHNATRAIGRSLKLMAPPHRNRLVGMQEIETLFCKYHSYVHGHYEPYEDIERLHRRLSSSGCEEVRALKECLP